MRVSPGQTQQSVLRVDRLVSLPDLLGLLSQGIDGQLPVKVDDLTLMHLFVDLFAEFLHGSLKLSIAETLVSVVGPKRRRTLIKTAGIGYVDVGECGAGPGVYL